MVAAEALGAAGITPVALAEKEGLALINGTDGMLGMLLLAVHDLRRCCATADITAAMSVEGLLGTDAVFAADLQALRPQPGQAVSAANLRALLAGSADRGQPPRPGGHPGAGRLLAALRAAGARRRPGHARPRRDRRGAGSSRPAVDNPVVTLDGRVESNGNFHGAPVGYVLDFLAIAVADLASISERRTDRFLDKARNAGLPPFLADDPGVDSGHMIAQYTQAGIVSELKRLAVPASVDSIPSSAMQEDHVSMGWAAARKLRRSVDGLARVLAIELLTAARALDLRAPLSPAPATAAVVAGLRETVDGPGPGPLPLARDRGRGASTSSPVARSGRRVRRRPARRAVEPYCRPPYAETPVVPTELEECEHHEPRHHRPPRHDAHRPQLADRGAAADAAEQPRPRGRRAARGPGRLRRHRQGRPRLEQLRRDDPHADHAARGRDHARAVRPAGRRDAHRTSGRRGC